MIKLAIVLFAAVIPATGLAYCGVHAGDRAPADLRWAKFCDYARVDAPWVVESLMSSNADWRQQGRAVYHRVELEKRLCRALASPAPACETDACRAVTLLVRAP